MLRIVNAPNELLSQKAKPVAKVNSDIKKLIEEMKITLDATEDPKGVGLAAPQVGESLQIFVIKHGPKSPFQVFINPVLTHDNAGQNPEKRRSGENRRTNRRKSAPKKLEGCLSLPNIWGTVARKQSIIVSFLDENGKKHKRKFKGFIATIIQHECDHLNGVLFPKKVLEQKGKLYKSKKNEKGEDEFNEINL